VDNQNALSKISNAYISVEIADAGLECLREGLKSLLGEQISGCEVASNAAHVSIAYGEGEVEVEALDRVATEISSLPFSVRVAGFEFLEGSTTPFDYLVVKLDSDGAFTAAVEAAQVCMKTKTFNGGFCSHISLLKFPKGSVTRDWAEEVIAEMNVCQAAAAALGRRVSLNGHNISVFDPERRCCVRKTFKAVAA
jgi:hypothetical protein